MASDLPLKILKPPVEMSNKTFVFEIAWWGWNLLRWSTGRSLCWYVATLYGATVFS